MDVRTVKGFGEEWAAFDQTRLSAGERQNIFDDYFSLFPAAALNTRARGADFGCGSGRWASLVAPRVGSLLALDASDAALAVARANLAAHKNVEVVLGDVSRVPVPSGSLDFAYSLGVLHHVPDTLGALREISRTLKGGAPFLLYLYYSFENRSFAFRSLWRASDIARRLISRCPKRLRLGIADAIAAVAYWPLARSARLWEKAFGAAPSGWPLMYYRDKSFYVMRTDSLDRFGTALEKRYSKSEIVALLESAGFHRIRFSPVQPYWTVVAERRYDA